MILDLILESLRATAGEKPQKAAEWAAHAIRKYGLLERALSLTESAVDPATRWLHAIMAENAGMPAETLETLWARVVDRDSRDFPEVLVQRARLAWRRKNGEGAAQFLRQAFYCEWDTSTLVRAETLTRKVFAGRPSKKSVRVALLGNCSAIMLRSAIQTLCSRDGLNAEIFEPDFGTWEQEILTENSSLYRFRPDFVVVLESWRDIAREDESGKPDSAVSQAIETTASRWDRLLSRMDCSVIHVMANRPPHDADMGLSLRSHNGISRMLYVYNRAIADRAPGRVLLIDSSALASRSSGPWEDLKQWTTNRVYPSMEVLPILADAVVSNIRYVCGYSSKLIAVDLDNTLWGGIIGEDGLAGIKLGPPSPVGERYQIFQTYLKSLTQRGVLLAAVSKNNPEDAARVFSEHDACVLKLTDFAAFEANWGSKADSLKRIAAKLRLGHESFVFLDDSPMERACVLAELPGIVVPNISGEPSESIGVLERFQFFQTAKLTEEDRNRTASYQALAAIGSGTNSTSEELLASLQIDVETGPVNDATAGRVEQLINKTNQFNLTTRRYAAAAIDELRKSPENWFFWYKLKDRFADHGLVGLILVKGANTEEWQIDLWLMSCRVIGRKLEEFMFNSVLRAAREAGASTLRAEYSPTPKNGLVANLLPGLGFHAIGEGHYEIDPRSASEMSIPFDMNYTGAGAAA